MTLREDYALTLSGELGAGAADNLRTRFGALLWALRRWLRGNGH